MTAIQSTTAIALQGRDARIALAGAQDKIGIAIFQDGLPRLPKGTSPSTHILKPNIKHLAKVWHSAANEAIIMRAAANCGLPPPRPSTNPTPGPASFAASIGSSARTGHLARSVPDAMDQAVRDVKPALVSSARILAERLRQFVLSTTKRLAARFAR